MPTKAQLEESLALFQNSDDVNQTIIFDLKAEIKHRDEERRELLATLEKARSAYKTLLIASRTHWLRLAKTLFRVNRKEFVSYMNVLNG